MSGRRWLRVAYLGAVAVLLVVATYLVSRHAPPIDVALLVVAEIGLLPLLAVVVRPGPHLAIRAAPDGFTTSEAQRHVNVLVTLVNHGRGAAADWRVEVTSDRLRSLKIDRTHARSATERLVDEEWRVLWQAAGEADTIGPRLERELRMVTDRFNAGEPLVAECHVEAARMKPRTARIEVEFQLDAPGPTVRVI